MNPRITANFSLLATLAMLAGLVQSMPQAMADGRVPPVYVPPPVLYVPPPVQVIPPPPPPRPRAPEPEDFCGITGEIQGPINRNLIAQATDHFVRDELLVPAIRFLRDQYNQIRAGSEEGQNLLTRVIVDQLDTRNGTQVTVFTQTIANIQLMNGTLLTMGRVVSTAEGTFRPIEFQVEPLGEVLRRPVNYPPNMRICRYMLVLPVTNDRGPRQMAFVERGSPRPPIYAPGVPFASKQIDILRNGN